MKEVGAKDGVVIRSVTTPESKTEKLNCGVQNRTVRNTKGVMSQNKDNEGTPP